MLKLVDQALSPDTVATLAEWQRSLNELPEFTVRVSQGKKLWGKYRQRPAMKKVVERLKSMCTGVERCMYCEDSAAHQVEHIRPKNHYPDQVFVWENFLYACQPCNGPKSAQVTIIREADGVEEVIRRGRVDAPPEGRQLLIDPRAEDPRAFFELDVNGTGHFLIREGLSGVDHRRAKYTLKVLRLNKRAVLTRMRKQAYGNYRARLREYVEVKRRPRIADKKTRLETLRDALLGLNHPTVWVEMVQQHQEIDELRRLFELAPEALGWKPTQAP